MNQSLEFFHYVLVVLPINLDALLQFIGRIIFHVFAEMSHKDIRVLSLKVNSIVIFNCIICYLLDFFLAFLQGIVNDLKNF